MSFFLLQASVMHHVYARDDFEGAKVTIMDLSYSKSLKDRRGAVYHYDANTVLSEQALYQQFGTLLDTWDYIKNAAMPDGTGDTVHKKM